MVHKSGGVKQNLSTMKWVRIDRSDTPLLKDIYHLVVYCWRESAKDIFLMGTDLGKAKKWPERIKFKSTFSASGNHHNQWSLLLPHPASPPYLSLPLYLSPLLSFDSLLSSPSPPLPSSPLFASLFLLILFHSPLHPSFLLLSLCCLLLPSSLTLSSPLYSPPLPSSLSSSFLPLHSSPLVYNLFSPWTRTGFLPSLHIKDSTSLE